MRPAAFSSADALCAGCFEEAKTSSPCIRCGFDPNGRRASIFLPLHTVLDDQYVVGRQLGHPGGFGITYLAWHPLLRSRVAIKEFLPRQLACRSPNGLQVVPHSHADAAAFEFGLAAFCREAQILEEMEHRNIVRVRGLFTANDTAYMVMRYYDGETLDQLLGRSGGRIPEAQALTLLAPILEALHQEVHPRSYLHRDISPQNIYLAKDRQGKTLPLLLDFGAARMALGDKTQSLSVILKPGYAPYEQYGQGTGLQGPWTDVYACAATLYRTVTGQIPAPALERWGNDRLVPPRQWVPELTPNLDQAVMRGLGLKETDRPRNIAAFRDLLYAPATPPSIPPDHRLPTPLLRVVQGERAGQDIPLDPDDPIVLGRDPRLCHLVLRRGDLSRQHCAIVFDSASRRFSVEDLDTPNGTFVVLDQGDSERLQPGQPVPLEPGKQIFLVDPQCLFQLVLESRTTQPERPLPNPQSTGPTSPTTVRRPSGCLLVLTGCLISSSLAITLPLLDVWSQLGAWFHTLLL